MTNKTELLPCPCCGGEAKEMYTYLTSVEWVACLKCGLETKGFGNAEAAAKAWNTRAAPAEDVRAVVEEPFVTFELKHYSTMEVRRVSFTGREVFDGITDTVYEKLNLQLCGCESVGETNVVDCNCLDYTDDFDLAGILNPQRPTVLPERKPASYRTSVGLIPYHEGWNACLDAVEELNKC